MSKHASDDRIKLNTLIFYSFCFHVMVLAALIFLPSAPSRKWTFGPVYSVQLVGMSALMEKGTTSALSREFMEAPSIDKPVVRKKSADSILSVPIKRIETPKKRDSVVERALENLRKRDSSSTGSEDATTSQVATKKVISQTAQAGDADRGMRIYYAEIWQRIKGQWIFPQDISPGKNIYAVIHARILRNGALGDINFEKRSGNPYFDESAMRAIRKASPFPPLPEQIGDKSIELGIRFHSSELR